jgi:hypothetical protein
VDEHAGLVPGCGITAHHNIGVGVLRGVRIEDRLADRAPAALSFEQGDAMEGASLPHQSPLPAIFPVFPLRRIERAALALDLDETGDSSGIMAWQRDSAVCEHPAAPLIDAEVVSNYPVPVLVGIDPPRVWRRLVGLSPSLR